MIARHWTVNLTNEQQISILRLRQEGEFSYEQL